MRGSLCLILLPAADCHSTQALGIGLVAFWKVGLVAEASLDQSIYDSILLVVLHVISSCQVQTMLLHDRPYSPLRSAALSNFCTLPGFGMLGICCKSFFKKVPQPNFNPRLLVSYPEHLAVRRESLMLQWRTADVVCNICRTTPPPTGSLHTGLWWEAHLTSQESHTRTGGSITHSWSQRWTTAAGW